MSLERFVHVEHEYKIDTKIKELRKKGKELLFFLCPNHTYNTVIYGVPKEKEEKYINIVHIIDAQNKKIYIICKKKY